MCSGNGEPERRRLILGAVEIGELEPGLPVDLPEAIGYLFLDARILRKTNENRPGIYVQQSHLGSLLMRRRNCVESSALAIQKLIGGSRCKRLIGNQFILNLQNAAVFVGGAEPGVFLDDYGRRS